MTVFIPNTTARCSRCEQAFLPTELREEQPFVYVCKNCDSPNNTIGLNPLGIMGAGHPYTSWVGKAPTPKKAPKHKGINVLSFPEKEVVQGPIFSSDRPAEEGNN